MRRRLTRKKTSLAFLFVLLLWIPVTQGQTELADEQHRQFASADLFRHLSPSVFVVVALDENNAPSTLGSGVAVRFPSASRPGYTPSFQEFLESRGSSFVVTSAHVVSEGYSVEVKQGEKLWPAKVEKIDPVIDLCLLRVEGLTAAVVPLRASDAVTVGERVYAIGAPEGLELTLSDGLISGFRHLAERKVIQTTAPISHGSSGGGLFGSDGMLIGITSFFLSDAENLNFAIPSESIEALALQRSSETARAWILIGDEAMDRQPPGAVTGLPPLRIGPEQDAWAKRAEHQLEILRSHWRIGVHAYQTALQLEPDKYQAWEKLGEAYSRLDDPRNMTDAFQRAIRLKPDDTSIWTSFREAYERVGDRVGAVDACKEALRGHSEDAALWVNLAHGYGKSDLKATLTALSEAERQGGVDSLTWWRIGSEYQLLRHYKQAESAYLQSIRLEPNNSLYLFELGWVYILDHKRSKAREVYQRLATVDPAAAAKLRDPLSSY